MANYLTYPCKEMRITQRYDGGTSHLAHLNGTPRDYSLDDGCTDGGRDWIYCGCDALRVVRITGTRDSKHTNAIWLTSTTACDLANGAKSIATLQFIHPNDDDLLKIKEGQIFKRGDKICREGRDGATANHLHLAVGLGTITNNGWKQNTRGAWVLTTTGGPIKPEDAFFVDPKFTRIRSSAALSFKKLPAEKPAVTYKTTETLNIRSGAGTTYAVVGQYEKGKKIAVTTTKSAGGLTWGRTDKGWVCLKYAKKVTK